MVYFLMPLYFVACIGMIPYLTLCFLTTHSFLANSRGTEHVYMDMVRSRPGPTNSKCDLLAAWDYFRI